MTLKDAVRVVDNITEAMKHSPIALLVIIINLMCIALVSYVLYLVGVNTANKDKVIAELTLRCGGK
jgi:type IV secretory pathway VirB3-like protein